MLEKQSYQLKEVTLSRLRECMRNLVAKGVRDLPSERDLCKLTGGSRRVIHELLAELEATGRLVRKNYKRSIANFDQMRMQIPLLFSTIGNTLPDNRTWGKLWHALETMAPDYGVKPELVLIGYSKEERLRQLNRLRQSPAKYLVCTNHRELKELHFDFDSKTTFFMDEDMCRDSQSVICWDNKQAGALLAQSLHMAGYRHPAIVQEVFEKPYHPFLLREQGFREKCEALGVHVKDSDVFRTRPRDNLTLLQRVQDYIRIGAQIAKSRAYDSVFIVTDEQIQLICDSMREQGVRLLEDLVVVAVNPTGDTDRYVYPYASATGQTSDIAKAILKRVVALETGGQTANLPMKFASYLFHPEFLPHREPRQGGMPLRREALSAD